MPPPGPAQVRVSARWVRPESNFGFKWDVRPQPGVRKVSRNIIASMPAGVLY